MLVSVLLKASLQLRILRLLDGSLVLAAQNLFKIQLITEACQLFGTEIVLDFLPILSWNGNIMQQLRNSPMGKSKQ